MGSEIVSALLVAVIGILIKMSHDLGAMKKSLSIQTRHQAARQDRFEKRLTKVEQSLPHCSFQCE